MKTLLIRFTLWLAARLSINLLAEARIAAGGDTLARGERWEGFYREAGGLRDMILAVRQGYFEASGALAPSDTDKLFEYALADRVAREIEREVLQVIVTGKAEAERVKITERENAARILRSV